MMSMPSGACDDGRAALAPNPVAAQVQRDAIEPGGEFRLALEAAERAERTQERLLGDVASIFLAADDAVRQGIDRPLPAQDELVEAVQVAPSRAGDQLFVGRGHQRRFHWASDAAGTALVGTHFTFAAQHI